MYTTEAAFTAAFDSLTRAALLADTCAGLQAHHDGVFGAFGALERRGACASLGARLEDFVWAFNRRKLALCAPL